MTPEKPAPRCETCPFFTNDNPGDTFGMCHNTNPPHHLFESAYPLISKDAWCSEHPLAPPTRLERNMTEAVSAVLYELQLIRQRQP